uniref:Ccr_08 putative toxin n=1 Tax=Crassispira cerithina TaxID=1077925 RepID=A0A098LWG6_CRACE
MLRLILAVALVAACLAFPAAKDGPSPGFQKAFQNFNPNAAAGFGGNGMMGGAGMNPNMFNGAQGFQGFLPQPHQKRNSYQHGGYQHQQSFDNFQGSGGMNNDNSDDSFALRNFNNDGY